MLLTVEKETRDIFKSIDSTTLILLLVVDNDAFDVQLAFTFASRSLWKLKPPIL